MFRADQPLWLPEGSVRAVIALSTNAAAIAAVWVPGLPSEFLWPAALTINAFYFASAPRRGSDEG